MILQPFIVFFCSVFCEDVKSGYLLNKINNQFLTYYPNLKSKEPRNSFSEFPLTEFFLESTNSSDTNYTITTNSDNKIRALTRTNRDGGYLTLNVEDEKYSQLMSLKVTSYNNFWEIKIEDKCLTAGLVETYLDSCRGIESQYWRIVERQDLEKVQERILEGELFDL